MRRILVFLLSTVLALGFTAAEAYAADGDNDDFVTAAGPLNPPPIQVGKHFYMRSRLNYDKCVEIPGWSKKNSTQADIWDCVNQGNAQWYLVFAGSTTGFDMYQVKNVHSKKCLNVQGGDPQDSTRIIQYKCSGQFNNLWRFYPHDGYWEIKSMDTNSLINIAGGVAKNGAKLIQWHQGNYKNEDFTLDLV